MFGKDKLEYIYGSKLFLIDDSGKPPEKPFQLNGTVLHRFDGEADWVVSKDGDNPGQDWFKQNAAFAKNYPELGVANMEDKWDEFKVLRAVAPGVAPPDTYLASEFPSNGKQDQELEAKVQATMNKYGLSSPEHREALKR